MLNETLSLLRPFYLYTIVSSKGGSPPPLPLKTSLLFSFTKNPKILFAPPFNEKTQWKATYMKQQKWIYQIFLEADRPHQVSLDIGFKSHLLSMKKKHTPTTDIITAIQTAKWSKSTHTHTHIYIYYIYVNNILFRIFKGKVVNLKIPRISLQKVCPPCPILRLFGFFLE